MQMRTAEEPLPLLKGSQLKKEHVKPGFPEGLRCFTNDLSEKPLCQDRHHNADCAGAASRKPGSSRRSGVAQFASRLLHPLASG